MWSMFATGQEKTVLDQLEKDSDRAAGIVAATVVETRLTEALAHRFNKDEAIHREIFRSSGPLGSFSNKIDVGYLLGLMSSNARKELIIIKNIRNAFAHNLDVVDFNSQKIANLCENLKIVEKHVVERERFIVSKSRDPNDPNKVTILFGVENRDVELSKPRTRYMLATMAFESLLRIRRSSDPKPSVPLF